MKAVSAPWRKSSYSAGNSDCVECASAAWSKSSYSGGQGSCAETAPLSTSVALRDSKNPHLPHLTLPRREWAAFLAAVRHGGL